MTDELIWVGLDSLWLLQFNIMVPALVKKRALKLWQVCVLYDPLLPAHLCHWPLGRKAFMRSS